MEEPWKKLTSFIPVLVSLGGFQSEALHEAGILVYCILPHTSSTLPKHSPPPLSPSLPFPLSLSPPHSVCVCVCVTPKAWVEAMESNPLRWSYIRAAQQQVSWAILVTFCWRHENRWKKNESQVIPATHALLKVNASQETRPQSPKIVWACHLLPKIITQEIALSEGRNYPITIKWHCHESAG